jgi:hypothetical protein
VKVGILQGSHPERVHIAGEGQASCGARSIGPWRTWSGSWREVDCLRCLRLAVFRNRREAVTIQRRIQGKGGIQVDAFEARS